MKIAVISDGLGASCQTAKSGFDSQPGRPDIFYFLHFVDLILAR